MLILKVKVIVRVIVILNLIVTLVLKLSSEFDSLSVKQKVNCQSYSYCY